MCPAACDADTVEQLGARGPESVPVRGIGGGYNGGSTRVLKPTCWFPELEDAPWARAEGEHGQVTLSSKKCHLSI